MIVSVCVILYLTTSIKVCKSHLMSKNILGETVYTVEEAAEVFQIPATTIRQYAREGRIRGRKIARAWHFTESELRSLFETSASEENSGEATEATEPHHSWQAAGPAATELDAVRPISNGDHLRAARLVGSGVIEGVRVSAQSLGNAVVIEYRCERASLINGLLQRDKISIGEGPESFSPLNPVQPGSLSRETNGWVFRIQFDTASPPRSVKIASRLIRLIPQEDTHGR